MTGLGATETAPIAIRTGHMAERGGRTKIGVRVPGVELKMVPGGAQIEARVRGPNVMPGYWREPELHRPRRSTRRVLCDRRRGTSRWTRRIRRRASLYHGRIAEDFKLATGTWVRVGPLRARLLAHFRPLRKDVAIAGADQGDIRAAGVSRSRRLPGPGSSA